MNRPWNFRRGATFLIVSNFQTILRYIPEPSLQLFAGLVCAGMAMAVIFRFVTG